MKQICIGIHVHEQPEQLHASLESIRRNTARPTQLILLPDGPDTATTHALQALRSIPQFGTAQPQGPPACFNRLAANTNADVLVLLESGARVGPRWLELLLASLEADPRNGLAGPSTNRAWNEQAVFPSRGGNNSEIAETAREAQRRFGTEARTLEPLYSLSEFCFAVRREVIADIGLADEAYQLGPCWEMDYNIRAARVGWQGVWACAAYVHRAPFTERRKREEPLRFEASKRRYQDKFCGLRLRGERTDYEPHCKGEECEHFAPPSLIEVKIPFESVLPAASATISKSPIGQWPGGRSEERSQAQTAPLAPLVSCVMVTRDRPEFVLQSIHYFQRQSYAARELLILDDGRESLEVRLPLNSGGYHSEDPRIRYVRLPRQQSIGAKRNLGCELARGSIIAHWDDDDWYAAERLKAQIEPLLSGEADISAMRSEVFFDLPRWEFWRCTDELHRRLFVEDVHGGTLVYRRRVWEQFARYPDRSLAEDAVFLREAVRRGARLGRLRKEGLFIYLRHATNSWSFNCGQFLDPRGWQRVPEPLMLAGDRAFYASHSLAASPANAAAGGTAPVISNDGPLVSCIMPTRNRRAFAGQAIDYFLRQTYTNSELIVADDGEDAISDLIPADPRIRYLRMDARMSLGAKRNVACQAARGDLIVHWDDDDWMASWRLRYQVRSMMDNGADLCGLDKLLFYDPGSDRAWEYVYPRGSRFWVAGNSLCYRKSFWCENPFPNVNVGEDTRFVWGARGRRMIALEDGSFFVAIIHDGNTSVKRTADPRYQARPPDLARALLGEDLQFYRDRGSKGVP